MAKTVIQTSDTFEQWRVKTNQISDDIGDLDDLISADKTSLVAAVNEAISGYSGRSGYSGWSGYSGRSGYSGWSGYSGSGISGYSGINGISGYSGWSGVSGYSGWSGISGTSGYSGAGTSGYSGWSGFSGIPGQAAASGYSGTSGKSGYSGISGYSGRMDGMGSQFNTDTTNTAPASNNFKFDASLFNNVTKIYIDNKDLSTNANLASYISTWSDSTSPNRGYIVVRSNTGGSPIVGVFIVNGSITDNSGWHTIPVNPLSGDRPNNGDICFLTFVRTGDSGRSGYSGWSGTSGYSGSGVSGYSGYSGLGLSGYSGTSGFSGTNGTNGSQGATGYSGWSGYSGRSGWSGHSGYSGYSGTFISSGSYQMTSLGVGTSYGLTGEIRATNNITAYYSDVRLKTNIKNIEDPIYKVMALGGYTFTQNKLAESFGYNDYKRQVGVLAQEVLAVLPEAVTMAPFDIDEDGKSKSGENYLTVRYEKIIPLLIEAIKELQHQIDELRKG